MAIDQQAIRTYFGKLGLEPEIADLYLALHSHGPQSISELARNSKVERTRIYRLIDRLMASNLIEIESRQRRGVIKAAPVANLNILINERQQALQNLQDELGLIEQVLVRNSLSNPAARVQFYQGPEGMRQMLWNGLRAKTELVGHDDPRKLSQIVGNVFIKDWAEEFGRRKLNGRWLVNDFSAGPAEPIIKGARCRLVETEVFKLRQPCVIYDDVVAHFLTQDGEPFGIETHNRGIADSQRQLFELAWQQAKVI